jgi:hypothetical protein
VAHYYQQNGDAMRDPDMVFEVFPASERLPVGLWLPLSYRQDGMGIDQEVYGENAAGQKTIKPKLAKDLAKFARQWDRNIAQQGFLDAARVMFDRRAAEAPAVNIAE